MKVSDHLRWDDFVAMRPARKLWATLSIALERKGMEKCKKAKLVDDPELYDKNVALQAHGSVRLRDELERNVRALLAKILGER